MTNKPAIDKNDVEKSIPINAPVRVVLNNHEKCTEPGKVIYGFFKGIEPNPHIGAAILDKNHGFHWLAQLVDPEGDDVIYDIHLGFIKSIDVAPETEVR